MTEAEAVPPEPPSVEVTLPVGLFCVPAAVPVTLTLKVQEVLCARVAPERLMTLVAWVAVISLFYCGVKGGLFTILTGGHNHVLGPSGSMINDSRVPWIRRDSRSRPNWSRTASSFTLRAEANQFHIS